MSNRTKTWIMKFFSEIRTVTTTFTKFKRKVEKYIDFTCMYINVQAHAYFIQETSTYWKTGKDMK